MQVGKSSLKTSRMFLHFPFPMDRLEDMSFSINLLVMMELPLAIRELFFRKRFLMWDAVKKELSPFVVWAINLGIEKLSRRKCLVVVN